LTIKFPEKKKKNNIYLFCAFIARREFHTKIIADLPESIDELNAFGDTVTEEIDFIEVSTNSLRFADSIGLPVFVVAGFMPKIMKKIYDNLMYPAFEARLPETIESIEHVARILVQVNIITILFLLMFSVCATLLICL